MKRKLILAALALAASSLLFITGCSNRPTCRTIAEMRAIERLSCEQYSDEMMSRGCYDLLEEELESMRRICLGPEAGIAGTEYCDLYCLVRKDGGLTWERATGWQKFRHAFGF